MIDTGILIVRLVVGLYVAGHGAQKLFGWFGGPGLGATIGGMGGGLGFLSVLVAGLSRRVQPV
jgi:putative oxidoreductase